MLIRQQDDQSAAQPQHNEAHKIPQLFKHIPQEHVSGFWNISRGSSPWRSNTDQHWCCQSKWCSTTGRLWFVPSKLLCISNSPPLSATPTNVDAPVQNKLEFSFCEPLQKSITSTSSFQPQFLSIENMISNIMASYTEMLTQMKTDMSDIKEELYDQKIQFKTRLNKWSNSNLISNNNWSNS